MSIVKLKTIAVGYGQGPFHPALLTDFAVHYWPNITKPTQDEARDWAQAALDSVEHAIEQITSQWNIWGADGSNPNGL